MKICITSNSSKNLYAATIAESIRNKFGIVSEFLCLDKKRLYKKNINMTKIKNRLMGHANHSINNNPTEYLKYAGAFYNNEFKSDSIVKFSQEYGSSIKFVSEINNYKGVKFIKENKIDLIINAGGGIFHEEIIDSPKIGILNAHMGFLPRFRGMNVLEWSLFDNFPPCVSIHFIVRKIDMGDILKMTRIPIFNGDSILELRNRSIYYNVLLLLDTIDDLMKGSECKINQLEEQGKQYFVMHPEIKSKIDSKLQSNSYHFLNEVIIESKNYVKIKEVYLSELNVA